MKNILVIGASGGIGSDLIHKLLDTNNKIFATYFKNSIEINHPNLELSYFDTQNFQFNQPILIKL